MADTKVRTSTTDWRTECAKADAADAMDSAQAGIAALERGQKYDRAYEFSNGRRFAEPDLPKP